MGVRHPKVFVFLLLFPLAAQETRSTIFGRVLDPHSSAIAGASVVLTNLNNNASVTLSTNETGYYEANLLMPGAYRIVGESAGFKRTVRTGVTLPVSTQMEISLKLELGELSQTVSVVAEAPVLETGNVTSGALMDNQSVMDLPVLGNNPMLLVQLTPGIQTDGVNNYLGLHSIVGSSDYYTAGKVGGNEWTIDGVPNQGGSRRAAYLPYSDTIQEFRVETSGFDVTTGRGTGASIVAISKAGTNQYHGTLTEQHWQQRWNATPYFVRQLYFRRITDAEAAGDTALATRLRSEPRQPSGHSNNYAATLGAPIVIPKLLNGRNRLFSFFSFNGFIDVKTEDPSNINRTVPTMANRRGDFSQFLNVDAARYQLYDPLTTRADPNRPTHYIRDPIPGNIIPQARMINPVYNSYVKLLPAPNNDPTDPRREPRVNYLAVGTPYNWNYKAFHQRLDYHHSNRHRFFVRWSYNNFLEDRGDWTYESARGLHSNGLNRVNTAGTVDWTYTHSSRTLFDFSAAVNNYRDGNRRPVAMSYKPSGVGLPKYMDDWAGDQHIIPQMSSSGYTTVGPDSVPTFSNFRMFSFKGDMSQVRVRHTIRAGLDTRQHFRTGGGGGNTSGNFSFNNSYTRKYDDNLQPPGDLAHSWAAFLMGLPGSMSVSTNSETYAMHSPYYGGYFQDTWRALPRLTLTLGFRLEYEHGPTERYNRMIGGFDPSAWLPITSRAEQVYASNPLPQRPPEQFLVQGGAVFPGAGDASRWGFSGEVMAMPRIAVAYQFGRKMVLRAGYGIFYDTLNVLNQGPNQTGFSRSTSTTITTNYGTTWQAGDPARGISPLVDPFPLKRDGTRFLLPSKGELGPMTLAGRSFTFTDWNTRHACQQRWRAGVQRQIGKSSVVEVTYTGSYTDRVYITRNLSPLPGQYWADGLERHSDVATYLRGNIPNPFRLANFPGLLESNPQLYDDMNSVSFFRGSTVQRQQLLRAFPHMTGLSRNYAPFGEVRVDSLEVNFQRRFSKGLTMSAGYTRLRARNADFYANEFEEQPTWRQSNNGRPHRFVANGIYQLPFGRRRTFLKSGTLSKLFGGFQTSITFQWQPGALLDFGNLFYYGSLDDINIDTRTLDHWFDTGDFEKNPARGPDSYHRRVFPTRIEGLRRDSTRQWNANLQREFPLKGERARLYLRCDMMNVFNRSQFNAPDTNPYSTNFGRVTSQSAAINRFLQVQGRIQF